MRRHLCLRGSWQRAAAVPTAAVLAVLLLSCDAHRTGWKSAQGPLATRWSGRVHPDRVLPEYPRPQMRRREWMNLNGLWEFQIPDAGDSLRFGKSLPDTILVPFPVESALSGVMRHADRVRYRRAFRIPPDWKGRRALLHFGAVDWEASVYLNGVLLGTHRGGYDSFVFDATDALVRNGVNELVVDVFDPTDAGEQPRGKQVLKPEGIFYTPCTGIWQTVWMEPVADAHIRSYTVVPGVDSSCIRLTVEGSPAAKNLQAQVSIRMGGKTISECAVPVGTAFRIPLVEPRLWSPDDPYLYGLSIVLEEDNRPVDQVDGYFGMRKISVGKDEKGVTRLLLNNRVVFQLGPLDQGFWPDGIYTAPTDEALKYDIEVAKQLGFNMIRKHVKVEPARWYAWADRLGMLVWQDMPSGDNATESKDPGLARRQFELELQRMIETHRNSPSIVMWVVFNEGWGQYDTERITGWVKSLDPSRLADNASGWTDKGTGDVKDMHLYPGPGSHPPEPSRASVLGEFGGLGLYVPGHAWRKEHWGYRNMTGAAEYAAAYEALFDRLWALRDEPGLSAAVYTQTTDVETEVNGLLTYDRDLLKIEPETARACHTDQILPAPGLTPEGGLFIDSLAVTLSNRKGLPVRITLDGSEPEPRSMPVEGPVVIRSSCTLKARTFAPDGRQSRTVSASFIKSAFRNPPAAPGSATPGLRIRYFEGTWDKLPDFETLGPAVTGTIPDFRIDRRRRNDDFGFAFDGWIRIPLDGLYTFFVASDDGVRLTVDGENVVEHDGLHGLEERSGQIALRSGWYPISLRYFEHLGGEGLSVRWAGPGISKSPVPEAALWH